VRLFVAVWPPPEVLDKVAALHRPPLEHGRWTTPDQWHVTLRFFGSVEDARPVVNALAGTELPAAVAELGPASRALSRSVLSIPVTGLDPLADAVRDATAALGKPPDPRPFRGHLTLARLRRGSAGALGGAAFSARFAVDEVTVVRSDLHPHGARYEVIESIPTT
jgi:2'-5' RNA ligase